MSTSLFNLIKIQNWIVTCKKAQKNYVLKELGVILLTKTLGLCE